MSSALSSSPCNLHERGKACCIMLGLTISKLAAVSEYANMVQEKYNEANGMDGACLLLNGLIGELCRIEDDLRVFMDEEDNHVA